MGRGRPPKPTATHKAKGSYRADRHGARLAEASSGIPKCPAHLTGDHRKAWNSIVAQAQQVNGLVTLADATALETCAIALSRFWESRRAVDRLRGKWIVDASHGPRVRPEVAEERAAETRLVAALNRFGLSPQARAAMRLPEDHGDDPFEKLAADLATLAEQARNGDGPDVGGTDEPAEPEPKKKTTRRSKSAASVEPVKPKKKTRAPSTNPAKPAKPRASSGKATPKKT